VSEKPSFVVLDLIRRVIVAVQLFTVSITVGFVGEDAEGGEADGIPWRAAGVGEDTRVDGCRRPYSVVVQEVDCSLGQVHRTAGQLGSNEWVRYHLYDVERCT